MDQKEKIKTATLSDIMRADDAVIRKVKELIDIHGVNILHDNSRISGASNGSPNEEERCKHEPQYLVELLLADEDWYNQHKDKAEYLKRTIAIGLGSLIVSALEQGWPREYLQQKMVKQCMSKSAAQLNSPEQFEYGFKQLLNIFEWCRQKEICKSEKNPSWRYRFSAFFRPPIGAFWKIGKVIATAGLSTLIGVGASIFTANNIAEKEQNQTGSPQVENAEYSESFSQLSDQLKELADLHKTEPATQPEPSTAIPETTTAQEETTEDNSALDKTVLEQMKAILESFVGLFDGIFDGSLAKELRIREKADQLIEEIKDTTKSSMGAFVQKVLDWVQTTFNKITDTFQTKEASTDAVTTQEPLS